MAKQKNAKKPLVAKKIEREKVYPTYETKTYAGDDSLTPEQAKELLGWEEETVESPFEGEYLLMLDAKKVRCSHVRNEHYTNRPFDESLARKYAQDMINKRWKLNGQSIGIGEYGDVITGQHRLIALVMAESDRVDKDKSAHWEEIWGEGPVSVPVDITYGISQEQDVIQTIDNTKPRTLSDNIYCNPKFFVKQTSVERKMLAKALEFTVRNLWARTGTKDERKRSFAPYLTHSEAMAFVESHPRTEECVVNIWKEDQKVNDENEPKQGIKSGLKLSYGECAALMYLMGASNTDGDDYRHLTEKYPRKGEQKVDWTNWDKAGAYWDLVGDRDEAFQPLFDALASLKNDVKSDNDPTKKERTACVINAWLKFKDDEEFGIGDVRPSYSNEEKREIANPPVLGGIDAVEEEDEDEDNPDGDDPAEVESEAARIKEERLRKIKDRHQARMKGNGETSSVDEEEEGESTEESEESEGEPSLSETIEDAMSEEEVEEPKPTRRPKPIVRKT